MSLKEKIGGTIVFGGGSNAQVIGSGVVNLNDGIKINNVSLFSNLKYNLLSVSQLCDNGKNKVVFYTEKVKVKKLKTRETIIKGNQLNDIYKVDLRYSPSKDLCLLGLKEDTWLWHRRFGHTSPRLINKLYNKDLVVELFKVYPNIEGVYEDCVRGKQHIVSFNSKKVISSSCPQDLVHIDLCGPMRVISLNHNRYVLVIVDDFSRFTWTIFLKNKYETFSEFEALMKKTQRKLRVHLVSIRSDHGTEFENLQFMDYWVEHGISHNFSAPRTPQ